MKEKKGIRLWFILMWTVVFLGADMGTSPFAHRVMASQSRADTVSDQEEMPDGDWSGIEKFLKGNSEETIPITFQDLMDGIRAGDGKKVGGMILSKLHQVLLREVAHGGKLAGEILAIGVIGAIFANFSSIFTGSQISQAAFFMTCLLAFTVLMEAFADSMIIARQVLTLQTEFMGVLIPCYFPVAAWTGGSVSSVAWMEFLFFLIGAVQWLYLSLLLPLIRVYVLLVMAGNMAGEDLLSKLTGLLQSVIEWGGRSLMGVVLGFQLIQGMVLPYADAVKTAGVQKLLQAIPGVGDGAGAVTKMLLGTGVLVKNTMGAAAVVVLITLSLIPILKLALLMFLYQFVAGILEPVGDKRLVACIGCVADGQKMLLKLASGGLFLFAVTIALICAGTNGTYAGI